MSFDLPIKYSTDGRSIDTVLEKGYILFWRSICFLTMCPSVSIISIQRQIPTQKIFWRGEHAGYWGRWAASSKPHIASSLVSATGANEARSVHLTSVPQSRALVKHSGIHLISLVIYCWSREARQAAKTAAKDDLSRGAERG